jgi:hypothetical protein
LNGAARITSRHCWRTTPRRWIAGAGTHNSGPLGRRHHRWKTHAGYQARYLWLTPHGLGFLTDHHGTHPISEQHARMILHAPPGLDLYPGIRLALAGQYAGPD